MLTLFSKKRDLTHLPFLAFFSFIGCAISISLMATTALLSHSPFVFPSLGPTAFLFFSSPTAPAASPRSAIISHTIAVFAGYLSLVLTGLTTAGPALLLGVTGPRIIAVALSLSLTAGLMILLRTSHPPAGATTLMISLGILAQPWQLGVLMVAVLLLTLFAVLFNRLAGLPYPLWKTISHEGSKKMTVGSGEDSANGLTRTATSGVNWRIHGQLQQFVVMPIPPVNNAEMLNNVVSKQSRSITH